MDRFRFELTEMAGKGQWIILHRSRTPSRARGTAGGIEISSYATIRETADITDAVTVVRSVLGPARVTIPGRRASRTVPA
jgi:hypothetical protein